MPPAARDFPDSVEELKTQLALERALGDVFESLASVPVTHVTQAIQRTLHLIGERLDFDIVSIWLPVGTSLDFRLSFIERRDAGPPPPDEMHAADRFPLTMNQISWDKAVVVPDTRELPREAERDAASWKSFGVRSSITFPLTDSGRLLGCLSFDTVRRAESWSTCLVQRLELVARAFASALGRRELYETLREGEERFRSVSEATLAGVYILVDGRVTYANAALIAMFGYPPEEVIGADPTAICHPDDRARVSRALWKGLTGESLSVRYECRVRCRNGDIKHIEVLGSRAVLQGRPALIGNIVDVTERKRAEEDVRASRDLMRSIVESAPIRIFWKDRESRYLGCNTAFARDAGKTSPEEVVGKTDFDLAWQREAERYRADDRLVMDSGEAREAYEEPQTTPSGKKVWLRTSKVPLRGPDGAVIGMLGVYDDVTREKANEEERARASSDLRESLVATVEAMASTVELRDLYTAGHQKRVAKLAAAIATEMGLAPETVEGIRFGGLIHDLGNIQIPTEVLVRPGPLSPTEFQMVKAHPQMGYEIVKDIRFPWPVARTILQHHERLDVTGYPAGLRGEEISIEARIVGIADVVEAMSSHRPYRPSLGIDAALAEIQAHRGTRFDARAVDACLRLFREKQFAF